MARDPYWLKQVKIAVDAWAVSASASVAGLGYPSSTLPDRGSDRRTGGNAPEYHLDRENRDSIKKINAAIQQLSNHKRKLLYYKHVEVLRVNEIMQLTKYDKRFIHRELYFTYVYLSGVLWLEVE